MKQSAKYSVIDLFCGIGGLTHGFRQERFHVAAGIDIDASCKFAYEQNNQAPFIAKSVEDLSGEELLALYPEKSMRILVGCAPCQPFSMYTQNKTSDDKWKLLNAFARLIAETNPSVVSMENVPNLLQHKKYPIFQEFLAALEACDYHVSYQLVYCPDYGIPQQRTRLVLLASKVVPIHLLPPTHLPDKYATVRGTIAHLPAIQDGERYAADPLHYTSSLSVLNKKRIRASKPGGTWKDWDANLVVDCHKKDTGKNYGSVYGRMEWDKPAPTMTTQFYGYGNGRFGHPEQDRAISPREAALFQTFPENYQFLPPNAQMPLRVLGQHIGNAVPVRLGRVIARSIKEHLNEYF
jgi:DNA (cytosine-5)-methyltransferase 1